MSDEIFIRPFAAQDAEAVLEINTAAVPATNLISLEELNELVTSALACLVALKNGKPVGFILCLGEGLPYTSANYLWISERRDRFAYIDRVCVAEDARGHRIGEKLYHALFETLCDTDRSFLCEVNERPPNPGSVKFHKRLGFQEVGRQDHGEKAVLFLEHPASTGVQS